MRSLRRQARRKPWRLLLLGAAALCGLAVYLLAFAHNASASEKLGDRSTFADSACIAYGPTGSDRHITVFLDPGHGGPDPGASGVAPGGKALEEKSLTLAVAMDLLPRLRQDGFRVAMSRVADTSVARLTPGSLNGGSYSIAGEHADIAARAACANAAGAQLLLSIHFDSFVDPSVGGVETLYDPSRPFSNRNHQFAERVQTAVLAVLAQHGWPVPDRGVISDTTAGTPALTSQGASYGHLLELGPALPGWFDRPSLMPGALCEPLFLTDPGEAAIVETTAGQQALATAFANAIQEYFHS